MADESIISYSDLIGKDNTFEEISKNIAKTKKELLDLAKVLSKDIKIANPKDVETLEKLEKQTKELTQAQKNLVKSEQAVAKAKKKNIELTNEELIQRESEKLARREALQIAKQQAIILKAEKNNIASLRAQLALTTLEWKKLTSEELKSSKEGKALVKTKLDLTNQLKRLEKQTGDTRRNVGNYTKSLGKLGKASAAVFLGRSLVDGLRKITGFFTNLIDKNKEFNDSLGGIDKAISKATSSLEFAGTKILVAFAPVIEKIANFISSLPAVFAGVAAAASQLGTNIAATFRKLGLGLELIFAKIERNNPFSSKNASQVEANIRRIEAAIVSQTQTQGSLSEAYNNAYNAVAKEQEEYLAAQAAREEKAEAAKRKKLRDDIAKRTKIELELRLKAIKTIQAALELAETQNIEDKQARLLALEELSFKTQQELREQQFEKFKEANEKQTEAIATFKKASDDLAKEQLKAHEQKLFDIKKDFAIKTIELNALTQEQIAANNRKAQDDINKAFGFDAEKLKKQQEEIAADDAKAIDDANKKKEDSTKKLLSNIGKAAQTISGEITKIFEKQADLAKDSVTEQQENLTRARDRAAQGLTSNIAFEEQELAKREAKQQRREKEAKTAAKLLTLFNLVSAYAANGDENALSRGLIDFSLLTAFEAGLDGFFDGTEDTGKAGNSMDSKGGRLAILHDNERVMTKAQNMLLNGMSNDMVVENALIGSAISDNFNPQSITGQNLFTKQKADFSESMQGSKAVSNSNNVLVKHLANIERRLAAQPNIGIEIEKVYDNMYKIVKSEIRTSLRKTGKRNL
jgi:hypothetical protein